MVIKKTADKESYEELSLCHFHGFHRILKVMINIRDSRCGLAHLLYGGPCRMEMAGNTPDWLKCPLNTEKNERKIKRCLEKVAVFPRENYLITGPEGIPLERWKAYLDRKKELIEDGR